MKKTFNAFMTYGEFERFKKEKNNDVKVRMIYDAIKNERELKEFTKKASKRRILPLFQYSEVSDGVELIIEMDAELVPSKKKMETTEGIRPDYYKNREYEPKDVIRDWNLDFNLGNVVKYISRAGLKTKDPYEDLKKAQTYLEFEIEDLERRKIDGK